MRWWSSEVGKKDGGSSTIWDAKASRENGIYMYKIPIVYKIINNKKTVLTLLFFIFFNLLSLADRAASRAEYVTRVSVYPFWPMTYVGNPLRIT